MWGDGLLEYFLKSSEHAKPSTRAKIEQERWTCWWTPWWMERHRRSFAPALLILLLLLQMVDELPDKWISFGGLIKSFWCFTPITILVALKQQHRVKLLGFGCSWQMKRLCCCIDGTSRLHYQVPVVLLHSPAFSPIGRHARMNFRAAVIFQVSFSQRFPGQHYAFFSLFLIGMWRCGCDRQEGNHLNGWERGDDRWQWGGWKCDWNRKAGATCLLYYIPPVCLLQTTTV